MSIEMKDIKDNIGEFHSNGLFLPTKTIVITGSVDEDMLDKHLKNIHILDQFEGTINIKLYTDGGEICVGRALFDAIKECKNLVRITCYGEVASCGTIILMAADERVMMPNSKIMIHAGDEGIPSNHPKNVDSIYANYRDDATWMEDIYLARINEKKRKDKKPLMKREELKDLLVWDKYLKPREAKSLGLIDTIGE